MDALSMQKTDQDPDLSGDQAPYSIDAERQYKDLVDELASNLRNLERDQTDNDKDESIAPYLCRVVQEVASEQGEASSSGADARADESSSCSGIRTIAEKPFACPRCPKRFSKATYLRQHSQLTHSDVKPFECETCAKRFKKAAHLKTHLLTHADTSPYRCDECGKNLTQEASLKAHLLVHAGIKPYACRECGKRFAKLYSLQRHEHTHTGERPYACDDCGKRFTAAANLKKHRLTHTDARPHACADCGKAFAQPSYLRQHMLTHERSLVVVGAANADDNDDRTRTLQLVDELIAPYLSRIAERQRDRESGPGPSAVERPHACALCPKAFAKVTHLRQHEQLTHSDARTFECDTCAKRFKKAAHLRTHRLTHADTSPFRCDVCGKNFTQDASLKAHLLKHAGIKPYACRAAVDGGCRKTFAKLYSLQRHELTHRRIAPTSTSETITKDVSVKQEPTEDD